jgi:hypothetical protein
MSTLKDEEMRELECELAKVAIRSVLLEWGMGWFNMSKEQRETALLHDITMYASGHSSIDDLRKWGELKELNITAYECMSVLLICRSWSIDGSYGHHLVKYAEETPGWDIDTIPLLKKYAKHVYGG